MRPLKQLRAVVILTLMALLALSTTVTVSAQQTIQRKGYFGTVAEISAQRLKLTAKDGTAVEMNMTADTAISIPAKEQASVTDVKAGDKVAVLAFDQSGNIIARQIQVIPTKSSRSHQTGVIVAKTANSITIQDEAGNQTVIAIPAGVSEKELGQFLVVITRKGPSGDRDMLVNSATAERIRDRLAALADKGGDLDRLRSALDRVTQNHVKVLERVLAKAPSAAIDALKNAIDNSKKGNAKAMDRVDNAIKARKPR